MDFLRSEPEAEEDPQSMREELQERAKKIVDDYFTDGAEHEINVRTFLSFFPPSLSSCAHPPPSTSFPV